MPQTRESNQTCRRHFIWPHTFLTVGLFGELTLGQQLEVLRCDMQRWNVDVTR